MLVLGVIKMETHTLGGRLMMSQLYLLFNHGIVQAQERNGQWTLKENEFDKMELECMALDPHNPDRIYVGTVKDGLWISDDAGKHWKQAGAGIKETRVTAVAVSSIETKNGYGIIWAGTEPSMLYRSEDGGETWSDCPALLDLPSRTTWSFPPRPYTHHVRYIQPDVFDVERIFVGIELGGVMRSMDKGQTWEDRKPGSQHDCHTLTMQSFLKNRIYEAGGGGFAESLDGGQTWETKNEGLADYNYLFDIAVSANNSDIILVSASHGPYNAYNASEANSILARKEGDQPWQIVNDGLPDAQGTTVSSLAASENEPGVFYSANNQGIYRSDDNGLHWRRIEMEWPEQYKQGRVKKLLLR